MEERETLCSHKRKRPEIFKIKNKKTKKPKVSTFPATCSRSDGIIAKYHDSKKKRKASEDFPPSETSNRKKSKVCEKKKKFDEAAVPVDGGSFRRKDPIRVKRIKAPNLRSVEKKKIEETDGSVHRRKIPFKVRRVFRPPTPTTKEDPDQSGGCSGLIQSGKKLSSDEESTWDQVSPATPFEDSLILSGDTRDYLVCALEEAGGSARGREAIQAGLIHPNSHVMESRSEPPLMQASQKEVNPGLIGGCPIPGGFGLRCLVGGARTPEYRGGFANRCRLKLMEAVWSEWYSPVVLGFRSDTWKYTNEGEIDWSGAIPIKLTPICPPHVKALNITSGTHAISNDYLNLLLKETGCKTTKSVPDDPEIGPHTGTESIDHLYTSWEEEYIKRFLKNDLKITSIREKKQVCESGYKSRVVADQTYNRSADKKRFDASSRVDLTALVQNRPLWSRGERKKKNRWTALNQLFTSLSRWTKSAADGREVNLRYKKEVRERGDHQEEAGFHQITSPSTARKQARAKK